ncbi:MAG: heavy metal translocating P-type ATPase [Promethearchaeia archaeon]
MRKISCSLDSCDAENLIGEKEEDESFFEEHFWFFIIPSAIILAFSIFLDFFTELNILSQILAFISISLSSYGIISEAIEDIKNKKITANILIVFAAIASFFIFHGQEGATAILLYAIAEYLEEITTDKSKRALAELLELAPNVALVKEGKNFIEKPTEQVKIGQIIGVKPGMKIPLDGKIIKGKAYIDESPITGESIPVFKKEGDEVFAASIVTDNFIEIEATSTVNNTIVAQIAKTIKDALANKSDHEKFIERFAKYYTPIILIVALLIMTLPSLLFNLDFNTWFYRGLVLLVVSCPCALTLSTPLANITALTKMAREGILVKGNKFIEMADNIEVIAFDKTGTLTEGNLKVFEVISFDIPEDKIIAIAASLERLSEHPIAKAIVKKAEKMNLNLYKVEDFEIVKGRGISGTINNEKFYIGNQIYLEKFNYKFPKEILENIGKSGTIPILLGNETSLLGIITIRDVLRISSPILINGLKNRGIKTVMISGDKQGVCNTIGECLDIDETYGELLPNEKLDEIKELKKKYKGVAMVGDGINDAPSLALADLGIAVGASATDLTLKTADVIIMSDDLNKILTYLYISNKTNRIIKQNIWTSIIVKVSFAVLTLFGLMTLWFAVGVGDMGVSLLVLANGMRIFRYKSDDMKISKKEIISNATMIICDNCRTKNIIPQHHGRDMLIKNNKLVCWRKMINSKHLAPCNEEIPLNCPLCNELRRVV